MARPLTPEKAAEFEDLLRFHEHFDQVGWVPPRNPPPDTRAEVARIEAQFGKSKALLGLRQALGDILEMTSSRSPAWVQQFDATCRAAGVKTLSECRVVYWSKYRRVLERGKIVNHEQFHMLTAIAIASDMALPLAPAERELLEAMLEDYERRAV
ncbi:MAG: hypothetical protein CVU22_06540 [Betaproteobacteria bacterium HGW-Betaproteobacteria-16]|nr:MAG: hypothetical protein CVU22_06540 [Betaproteobacteria bacterium HGW-Betaproteobacteria-16]